MILSHISELVQNVPLLELRQVQIPNNNKIFAKCEYLNPAGGIKDKTAIYMIEQALKKGVLKQDSIIIEATAGNTGLGIALGALKYKLKCVFVVPKHFSPQKQMLMRALGAQLINTPQSEGMRGAILKAKELEKSIKNAFCLRQFENLDNPKAHYDNTAKEFYDDLKGRIDYFVCGAGSGGTFSGIAKYLKEQNPNIKTVLCDPRGSVIGGFDEKICSSIEGIGNDFIPQTMDISLIDDVIKMSDDEALQGVEILAKEEGVLAGISSGAAFMACLKLAGKSSDANIVTIFSDKLERYLDREYFKIWS